MWLDAEDGWEGSLSLLGRSGPNPTPRQTSGQLYVVGVGGGSRHWPGRITTVWICLPHLGSGLMGMSLAGGPNPSCWVEEENA